VTQKIKKPAELEAKLREIHIDTTFPIEHGLSESAKKNTPLAWQISSDKSWIYKWARTRISPCTSINNKLGGLQRNGQEKHECTKGRACCYGWIGQQSGSGFCDLAPSILHYNWF
jgi:hypothetical protein